jgi:hypothetical protein
MIIEPVAPKDRLTGRRSATVSAGPMPGITPTAVPSITPTSANIRFIGCSAVPSPSIRRRRVSMASYRKARSMTRSSGPAGRARPRP